MRRLKLIHWVLLALLVLALPATSHAQIAVGVAVHIGPPALPVYVQPVCPAPGYIWTPGYWAYGPDGYFWVPGTWVLAPTPGLLWTPGYWGWGAGGYFWHGGYWGPHVGFYGGINYGFGYGGVGFVGGEWRGGTFFYNSAVSAVNVNVVHNTYVNKTVVNNTTNINRVSYNGGTGGITARPTAAEQAAANEKHIAPTAAQSQHYQAASTNPSLRSSVNHGNPAVAATAHAGTFSGPGVIAAHGATQNAALAKTNTQANATNQAKTTNTGTKNYGANQKTGTTSKPPKPQGGNAGHAAQEKPKSHPQESKERGGKPPR